MVLGYQSHGGRVLSAPGANLVESNIVYSGDQIRYDLQGITLQHGRGAQKPVAGVVTTRQNLNVSSFSKLL